jgi:two-component system response regulator AtoC
VEAEPALRSHLKDLLEEWGYDPVATGSVEEALGALASTRFAFSLVDMDLNGTDGIDLLQRLKLHGGDPGPIIFLFNPPDTKRIGEAAALGADDFLQKPFKPEELENAIKVVSAAPRRVWGRPSGDDPTPRLEHEVSLWRSPRMQEVWRVIEQAAQVDITVLLCGETGTGKDLAARAIHHLSFRRRRPYVKVNCAAVPRELLESELFGHERGAFTGAHQLKIGKFESADHGTIFLDEIGDLHPALQAKLLHVLQDGEFSRVGGKSTIKVDVRIIAATNQELEKAVAAGRFREDLYYRLNVIQIVVPPLRERQEEIPFLVNYFTERYARVFNRQRFTIPPRVMERLTQHTYPGNVRELENIVKRMIVLNDPAVFPTTLPRPAGNGEGSGQRVETQAISLKTIAREAAMAAEREAMAKVLEQVRWNRVKAAKLLKISYRALLYKIKQVGLEPELRGSP